MAHCGLRCPSTSRTSKILFVHLNRMNLSMKLLFTIKIKRDNGIDQLSIQYCFVYGQFKYCFEKGQFKVVNFC